MGTFEKLRFFYHVAKEGSIKKACAVLTTTEARVSRYVADLENELKTKLFIRRKRGLQLTEGGRELFSSVQSSMSNLENILSDFPSQEMKTNQLTILTTNGVISILLSRAVADFLKENQEIDIKILTTNEDIDFLNSKANVAVIPKSPDTEGVTQKKITTLHSKLFSSKSYLEKHGVPGSLEDLNNHHLVSFYPDLPGNRGNADWHLIKGTDGKLYRRTRLSINSVICQYEAVRRGFGIFAIAKEFPYIWEGGLIPVLPEEEGKKFDIYYVTKSGEFPSELEEKLYDYLKFYLNSSH